MNPLALDAVVIQENDLLTPLCCKIITKFQTLSQVVVICVKV